MKLWDFDCLKWLSVPRLWARIKQLEDDVVFLDTERKRMRDMADQSHRSFNEVAAVKFAYEAANAQLQKELSELRMELRKSQTVNTGEVNMTIITPDTDSFTRTKSQISAEAQKANTAAARRNTKPAPKKRKRD